MFVFTEIENPGPQVTRLLEDLVRNQVIEMVRVRATDADHPIALACDAPLV